MWAKAGHKGFSKKGRRDHLLICSLNDRGDVQKHQCPLASKPRCVHVLQSPSQATSLQPCSVHSALLVIMMVPVDSAWEGLSDRCNLQACLCQSLDAKLKV